jgi:chemotaxis regulatin CheY-phosphate phosphatase CheZ
MKPTLTKTAAKPRQRKTGSGARSAPATGQVLQELKTLAKELNQAAKGLSKRAATDPKVISAILGNVERMMMEAANKSLAEAESAKQIIAGTRDALGKDWSRRQIDEALVGIGGHLTNIIVAQEFQDLADQAIRKAMKALVGAIVVDAEERKLSQNEVDGLLKGLLA